MGNCASNSQEAEGKARSDMIDRQIEEDSKKYKRECKILLLGTCATPVLCPSEGNREGKILCLRESSAPWVSTANVAVIRTSRDSHTKTELLLFAMDACIRTHLRLHAHIPAYSFWLVFVLMPCIAFPYIHLLTRTPWPSDRFRRVRKVDNSQANEDHSSKRLLS